MTENLKIVSNNSIVNYLLNRPTVEYTLEGALQKIEEIQKIEHNERRIDTLLEFCLEAPDSIMKSLGMLDWTKLGKTEHFMIILWCRNRELDNIKEILEFQLKTIISEVKSFEEKEFLTKTFQKMYNNILKKELTSK